VVERFDVRRKQFEARQKGERRILASFVKKCKGNLKVFRNRRREIMESQIEQEIERVNDANETIMDSTYTFINTSAAAAEAQYSTQITAVVQSRHRDEVRFNTFRDQTTRFRKAEYDRAAETYEKACDKYKQVHQNHSEFQTRTYETLVAQDARNAEVYDTLQNDVGSSIEDLTMHAKAVIMAQQNIMEVQQELIHEAMFESFKGDHESKVFPLPLFDMFRDTANILKEQVKSHHATVQSSLADFNNKQADPSLASPFPDTPTPIIPDPPAAPSWVLYYDEENDHSYYYHEATNESVWESEATAEILDDVVTHAKLEEEYEAALSGGYETNEAPVTPRLTAPPAFTPPPFLSPLKAKNPPPLIERTQKKILSRVDDFFRDRLQTIDHESLKFRSEFTNTANNEKEKLSKLHADLSYRVASLWIDVEAQQRDFARSQKDAIAAFSSDQRQMIGSRGDDALVHETISFWNHRLIQNQLLVNELLDASTVLEATEINLGLATTINASVALSQKDHHLPPPNLADSIASEALSSAAASILLDQITEHSSKLVLPLETLLSLPPVLSLPPHVLSPALAAAECEAPLPPHGSAHSSPTRTSSSSLHNTQLPHFSVCAFADAVGAIQASRATTNAIVDNAAFGGNSLAFSMFETAIKRKLEDEIGTLADVAVAAISSNFSDGTPITPITYFQTLMYSSVSAVLSPGDVYYLLSSYLLSKSLPTPELLTALWTPTITSAAYLAFLTSGQIATPSKLAPANEDCASPYISSILTSCLTPMGENLSVDRISSALSSAPSLLLPKPFALAIISYAASSTSRIVPDDHTLPPSYCFNVATPSTIESITHAVCTILSVDFLSHLPSLSTTQISQITSLADSSKRLDDCLAEYEGQSDTPLREKNVHHARRVMDVNILHDLLALGENWNVRDLFSSYDEITESAEPNKSLSHANSVALISLGSVLVEPNEHEIRLVNQNSRHLGWNNRVFVDFRSLTAAAPLAATAVLRRYDTAFTSYRRNVFERAVPPAAPETVLALTSMTTRRLNREYNQTVATRELAENETFHTLNHLRCTLLKISNDFEQQRIKNYVKDREVFVSTQASSSSVIVSTVSAQSEALDAFVSNTLQKLQDNTQTEVLLVKEFRRSARSTVESFNSQLGSLLEETERIFLRSVEFHKKLSEDVVRTCEDKMYVGGGLSGGIEKMLAASLDALNAKTSESAAQYAAEEQNVKYEHEEAMKKLIGALHNANKEIFEKAAMLLVEVSEATNERLIQCDAELEEAKTKAHQIMADAEKVVAEKAKEEVDEATKTGGQDRFSAVTAKLNNDSTSVIMKAATDEATALFNAASEKMKSVEEEIAVVAQKLPERVDFIVKSLDVKIDGLRVTEKARCDKSAAAVVTVMLEFVEKQENTVLGAGEETIRELKRLCSENALDVQETEVGMIKNVEKQVTANYVADAASFSMRKEENLAWVTEAKKENSAESEKIFEHTLDRSNTASDAEMKFLVTCHDVLATLATSRIGLLNKEFDKQADLQVNEALTFSSEQTVAMIEGSNERCVSLLLDSLVSQVEKENEVEILFRGRLEQEKIADDNVKEKEATMLEEFVGSMEQAFSSNEVKQKREAEKAAANLLSLCSGLLSDARERRVRSNDMTKNISAMSQEMEKVAVARRTKLFQGLAEKRRAEAESAIKNGYTMMAPIDLMTWSGNMEADMEKFSGKVNCNNTLVLSFRGEGFQHEDKSLLKMFDGPTKNFFVVLSGFDQVNEKVVELGWTEIVLDTNDPKFEKLLLVKKHDHDVSRMKVCLYSADLQSSSENVDDHTKLDEEDFTYEQLVHTSRGSMSFVLGKGTMHVEARTAILGDLSQELKSAVMLGKTEGLVVEKNWDLIKKQEAVKMSTVVLKEVMEEGLQCGIRAVAVKRAEEEAARALRMAEQERGGAEEAARAEVDKALEIANAVAAAEEAKADEEDAKALEAAKTRKRAHTVNHSSAGHALAVTERAELDAENEEVAARTGRGRAHTVHHRSAGDANKGFEEEQDEAELAKARQSSRVRTHTVGHKAAGDAVESMADSEDGSLGTVHLEIVQIDGKEFLVDGMSQKVYTPDDDQLFLGILDENGRIDTTAEDSSDSEEEDTEDGENSTVKQERMEVASAVTLQLEVRAIDGVEYLVEASSGKVYTHDADQLFLGKLGARGDIDTGALDSSDSEEEEKQIVGEMVGVEGGGSLEEGVSMVTSIDTESVGLVGESLLSAPSVNLALKVVGDWGEVLVDEKSLKCYRNDEGQEYLGRLNAVGEIDRGVEDSSVEESVVETRAGKGGVKLVPPSGAAEVRGSMGGRVEEDSANESESESDNELEQHDVEGVLYLVDVKSRKVYTNDEHQTFVGKMYGKTIDRGEKDSSEDEGSDAEFEH